jgi:integrase
LRAENEEDRLSSTDLVEVVLQELVAQGDLLPGTLADRANVLRRFAAHAEQAVGARHADEVTRAGVELFVHALRSDGSEPSLADRHRRRASVRLLYAVGRRLGLISIDPGRDIELPPRSSLRVRPLADEEVELGRAWAVNSVSNLRRPMAWALAEATAWTSEITAARVADVDLDKSRVWLHGNPTKDPRWSPLTEWGARQLARRLRQAHPLDGETSLVTWRTAPRSGHAAASQAIKETLRAAGLDRELGVRPRSIVAWRGRSLLEQGRDIVEVAKALGYRSLDEAADFVGYAWRGEPS